MGFNLVRKAEYGKKLKKVAWNSVDFPLVLLQGAEFMIQDGWHNHYIAATGDGSNQTMITTGAG